MALRRRRAAAALLGLGLALANASVALAHGGPAGDRGVLSGDSMFIPFASSFLAGLVGYTLMVWDPRSVRK